MKRWLSILMFCGALSLWAAGRSPREPGPASSHPAGWVPVAVFARDHGFNSVKEGEDQVELKGPQSTLVLYKGSRKAELDGVILWLNEAVTGIKGKWSIADVDIQKTLDPILRPSGSLAGGGHQVIVLDAGHGGDDSGSRSANGLLEKTVALDITERVRTHLMANGYQVYLTRHRDQGMALKERPRKANTWKADVFVSIHLNAVDHYQANGVETFALSIPSYNSTNDPAGFRPSQITHPGNKHDAANMVLAHAIQKSMLEGNDVEDRGVRRARFLVLKESDCPAALVECGFLSNPREAGRLSVPYYREKMALSVSAGIDNYLREVRKAVVAAAPAPVKGEEP